MTDDILDMIVDWYIRHDCKIFLCVIMSCIYTHIHIYIYICICIYIHTHIHTYTHTHTYTYIHTYIHTHTHTHTCSQIPNNSRPVSRPRQHTMSHTIIAGFWVLRAVTCSRYSEDRLRMLLECYIICPGFDVENPGRAVTAARVYIVSVLLLLYVLFLLFCVCVYVFVCILVLCVFIVCEKEIDR
jgi:hypothetical protein